MKGTVSLVSLGLELPRRVQDPEERAQHRGSLCKWVRESQRAQMLKEQVKS